MISLIIWGLVLASIYDVIRYAVQRAAYPKHPLQFCPQCGQKLPAHHEACTWRPPKKPAPPIGSIILVSICALITIFGMYVDSASPSAAPVIYSSPIPSRTPWPTSTSTPARKNTDCFHWGQVSSYNVGSTLCVFGAVVRIESTYAYILRFKYGRENFYFVSGSVWWPDLRIGDCVMARGEILLSAEKVPYMNTTDILYYCEPWMQFPTGTWIQTPRGKHLLTNCNQPYM